MVAEKIGKWKTTPRQAAKAAFFTPLAAAGVTTAPFLIFGELFYLFFGTALAAWTIGILVLGLPAWALLHRLGLRSRETAIWTGSALAILGVWVWIGIARGPAWLAMLAFLIGPVGAFAGWLLHRLAYGKLPSAELGAAGD